MKAIIRQAIACLCCMGRLAVFIWFILAVVFAAKIIKLEESPIAWVSWFFVGGWYTALMFFVLEPRWMTEQWQDSVKIEDERFLRSTTFVTGIGWMAGALVVAGYANWLIMGCSVLAASVIRRLSLGPRVLGRNYTEY